MILTSFGCQITPGTPTTPQDRRSEATPRDAESLLAEARTADPDVAASLYLEAARELLARGDLAQAEAALDSIDAERLPRKSRFTFDVTRAEVALDGGRALDALRILESLPIGNRSQMQESSVLLARAAAEAGQPARAAEALMQLEEPADRDAAYELNDRIWAYLVQAPPLEIESRAAVPDDPVPQGWWQLVAALERAFDVNEQRLQLARWQRQFADHPAARFPPRALGLVEHPSFTARRIALLLPFSGPLATAGRAVRDGFVAAFYRSEADRSILVYDTTDQDIGALYEQAVQDGAEAIVGPLDKTSVSALNALPVRQLPALVLNQLSWPETPAPGIYQFALAIEDEGRAIARRVAEDRRLRIVLLRSDEDWAQRATSAFFEAWPGGRDALVASDVIYDIKGLTDTIARALLVDQSAARANELSAMLGQSLEFVPRRREDIDAVVAFVDSLQARALNPGLAYYFASDVPVYTSSQAVQGLDRSGLGDLEGARVSQIPWRIGTDPVRTELEGAFADARGALSSLFAFGVDAYRIVDRLGTLSSLPHGRILGGTGILTFAEDGRVQRDLAWSIVRGGRIDPLPVIVMSPPAE